MDISHGLNTSQQEAVEAGDGACLIIAIPGSGKTRVLTHRIAYLIKEKSVNPHNIIAVTFTNKAAREMKSRIIKLINNDSAKDIWASTFHAAGVKILRRFGDKLGYDKNFVIYDEKESQSVYDKILREHGIQRDLFAEDGTELLEFIEKIKRNLWDDDQISRSMQREEYGIYSQYQEALLSNNAMDFSDLLYLQIKLFNKFPEILNLYANRFQYVLVDEFQDVNDVQYQLIKKYSSVHKNIFVVGDPNQNIYSWRGAEIKHIMTFEEDYPNCKVIKLTKNYRSTKHILSASAKLISHNKQRKEISLETDNDQGDMIELAVLEDDESEARFVADSIVEGKRFNSRKWNDHAILYRINAMSRHIELALRRNSIPYKLIGSLSFFDRREIRDCIAYLKFLVNPKDTISFARIANVPKRNIGIATVAKLESVVKHKSLSMMEVLKDFDKHIALPGIRLKESIKHFVSIFESAAKEDTPVKAFHHIIKESGYLEMCAASDCSDQTFRKDNCLELLNYLNDYCNKTSDATLAGFLRNVTLITDQDEIDDKDVVNVMTIHAAKGLEFPVVFIIGMEEKIIPHERSLKTGDIEEERRICFVGMTRAKQELFLTRAKNRIKYNTVINNRPSRFLSESGLLKK